MPSDFMDEIKLRKERKEKEQNKRLKSIIFSLGLLIIGIIVLLTFIGAPYLHYFLPVDSPSNSIESTETPSVSMNSYLKPVGLDASADLKVSEDTVHNEISRSWVAGKIKNTGSRSYDGVAVYFDLYDAQGKPIGSTYTLIGNLAPGDVKDFSTNPSSGDAASAKIKYVLGS
jgi:hypothetical protein